MTVSVKEMNEESGSSLQEVTLGSWKQQSGSVSLIDPFRTFRRRRGDGGGQPEVPLLLFTP